MCIRDSGTPIDVLTDSFGFRRYAVTADKGFFLLSLIHI